MLAFTELSSTDGLRPAAVCAAEEDTCHHESAAMRIGNATANMSPLTLMRRSFFRDALSFMRRSVSHRPRSRRGAVRQLSFTFGQSGGSTIYVAPMITRTQL